MAIDTETRRRSTLSLFPGFPVVEPTADTGITAADRAHICGFYSRSLLIFDWEDGNVLKKTERGTELTTGSLPPGNWILMIKSIDTSGNYSENAAGVAITVNNTFDVIETRAEAPRWTGTKVDCLKHDVSGSLVPDSQNLASADGWDTFDLFDPNPVNSYVYTSKEKDLGFDAIDMRVWNDHVASFGRGVTGSGPTVTLELDYRTASGTYDGYENWTVGTIDGRYVKSRISVDVLAGGAAIISTFTNTFDAEERTESDSDVVVAVSGTAITFTTPFHVKPAVTLQVDGGSALIPVKGSVTTTGFTAFVYNTSGTDVGGTIDWVATGA